MPKRNETLKFTAKWIANGRNEGYGSWIKLSNETYNLDPSRNDITTDPNFNIK